MLQLAARELFVRFAREGLPDISGAMSEYLAGGGKSSAKTSPAMAEPSAASTPFMPADVWARLAATVQLEAARSRNEQALNPDSVLLRPDPLLAPKKSPVRREKEDFDLSSPSRVILVACLAMVVGIVLTLWISTRPAPRRASSATAPASSLRAPATVTPASAATQRVNP
jgi:hypothetical protein